MLSDWRAVPLCSCLDYTITRIALALSLAAPTPSPGHPVRLVNQGHSPPRVVQRSVSPCFLAAVLFLLPARKMIFHSSGERLARCLLRACAHVAEGALRFIDCATRKRHSAWSTPIFLLNRKWRKRTKRAQFQGIERGLREVVVVVVQTSVCTQDTLIGACLARNCLCMHNAYAALMHA